MASLDVRAAPSQLAPWVACLAIAGLLNGCAGDRKQVPTRTATSHVWQHGAKTYAVTYAVTYTVTKGDTLYSIAFRFGTDYRALATVNHIEPPFVIHPGQRLRVPGEVAPVAESAVAGDGKPLQKTGEWGPAKPDGKASDAAGAVNRPLPPASHQGAPVTQTPVPVGGTVVFAWPAAGRVLRGFGIDSKGVNNKGVDFAGVTGDPVLAAAAGEVVYAGDGLRGYGPLIILRHGDLYLTAYGHNDRLLVREGDHVKARQKIAEIGSNGSDESSLHFEIRREGRPVDPVRLLPRR